MCRPTSPWLLYCVWLLYRRVMNWEVCWIWGSCRCSGGGLVFSNCGSNWAHDVLHKDRTVKYRVRKSRYELFSNPSDLENHSEVGFFSFGQLRMRSASLEWPEGPFKDLTTWYTVNCFSETWIMQFWEPNSFFSLCYGLKCNLYRLIQSCVALHTSACIGFCKNVGHMLESSESKRCTTEIW